MTGVQSLTAHFHFRERPGKSTQCIRNEAYGFSCSVFVHLLIVNVMSRTGNEPDLERGVDDVSLGLPF